MKTVESFLGANAGADVACNISAFQLKSKCEEYATVDDVPFVDILSPGSLVLGAARNDLNLTCACDGLSNSTSVNRFWYSMVGTGECLSAFVWSDVSFTRKLRAEETYYELYYALIFKLSVSDFDLAPR